MSFTIQTDTFELQAQCSIPSFQKRGELVTSIVTSAIEMTLKFCEELSEDDLGPDYIEWKDRPEIVSAFLDTHLFHKWAGMVESDLREYGVQIPE